MAISGKNVLGSTLQPCSMDPLTGFYRTGCCDTGAGDHGVHVICAVMTSEFLVYSREKGNDLLTPRPEYGFAGLKPGDRWCLCAGRWKEAFESDMAPPVVLAATHMAALEVVDLEQLMELAVDGGEERGEGKAG